MSSIATPLAYTDMYTNATSAVMTFSHGFIDIYTYSADVDYGAQANDFSNTDPTWRNVQPAMKMLGSGLIRFEYKSETTTNQRSCDSVKSLSISIDRKKSKTIRASGGDDDACLHSPFNVY